MGRWAQQARWAGGHGGHGGQVGRWARSQRRPTCRARCRPSRGVLTIKLPLSPRADGKDSEMNPRPGATSGSLARYQASLAGRELHCALSEGVDSWWEGSPLLTDVISPTCCVPGTSTAGPGAGDGGQQWTFLGGGFALQTPIIGNEWSFSLSWGVPGGCHPVHLVFTEKGADL